MGQPVSYEAIVISGLCGVGLKIVWDWAISGRIKKEAPYVTSKECETHREKCCIAQTKRDVSNLNVRVTGTEKQLDEGKKTFSEIQTDIKGINKSITKIAATMEFLKPEKVVTHGSHRN
ncbi:hypothetical protein [Desulfospira joergensenii]|uniref:hypothetical protein n=1 Tax=Desulfospira joergensenii TaxID=53329 RepID=UPI0003B42479|nr:hypothetical protein [Desulfospira joergensenii]